VTLDEARLRIGEGVVYVPYIGDYEMGEIINVSERWVFVRYTGERQSKATEPARLTFASEFRRK